MSDERKSSIPNRLKGVILAVAAAGIAVILIFVGPQSDGTIELYVDDYATVSTDCAEDVRVVFENKVFCPGNRIVTFKRAGTIKPSDSGHTAEIELSDGKVGTVLGNAPSPLDGAPALALVEWDDQDWTEWGVDEPKVVSLPKLTATVHADHIKFNR